MSLFNVEAEQALLGALILNNSYYQEVKGIVGPGDFSTSAYQDVYLTISRMLEEGWPVDLVTLTNRMRVDSLLIRNGGAPMVAALVDKVPSIMNAAHYAGIVAECSKARQLNSYLERGAETLRSGGAFGEALACLRRDLGWLEPSNECEGWAGWEDLYEAWREAQSSAGRLTLGYPSIDNVIEAQVGEVAYLCGMSTSGKTAFGFNMAREVLLRDKEARCAWVSVETTKPRAGGRLLEISSGANARELGRQLRTSGSIPQAFVDAMRKAYERFEYWIVGKPSIEAVAEAVEKVEKAKWGGKPATHIWIDHLGGMASKYLAKHGETEAGTMTAHEIQQWAKSRPSFVTVCAHLRKDGSVTEPVTREQIRGSGVTQDLADYLWGIWRPHAMKREEDTTLNMSILKNKEGPLVDAIPFVWDGPSLRVTEMGTPF